ncbi:hypothetical protein BGZ75_009309 [Mortierella antarctica]|nr:hypothetical protein BGZ67_000649 [Mortierella alpina]KAF9979710.1 hypothetical protein BGZ75_009309 [Mortierella antarctica]
MTSSGTGTSTGTPTGFMAEYMSDLKQSQDLTSFLQQNQPAYNPTTSSTSATPAGTELSSASKDASAKSGSTDESSDTNNTSSSSSDSSSSSSSIPSSFSSTSSDPTTRPLDGKSTAASHTVPSAHAIYQRHATQGAAMDNCADLNMELADCLSGKAGTWWDRASMCMKAKERFGKCCRLNREVLEKKGYAREGNTREQNQEIQDYADDYTQKVMKDDVE